MKSIRNILAVSIWIFFAACTPDKDFENKKSRLIKPDSSRFAHMVLIEGLDEPLAMEILPDNSVLFIERKGAVRLYDAKDEQLKTVAHFDVFSGIEDGLLGMALDPQFAENHWIYFYYAVAGDKWINRLSRFVYRAGTLVKSSEKVMIEIPTQRKYCCHSAGAIAFGPDGLLYLATGDNTNAEEAEGYVPIDERPGHELADDQATAANTNDLRGKILRIKPEPDGSYSIPEGNLFRKDQKNTRPEIYVMGCRNPFKITVDMKTGFLYWGDVGPYTKVEGREGTLSYDEINQAREPGFFGWPYFLGENEAFPYYDFATRTEGSKFDPLNPVNDSPNNTGMRALPPARPALIWYGRLPSAKFPLVGKGGASAMAGPVYHSEYYPDSNARLPEYYDGKLFIYDWVRRWIMVVTLDEKGNYIAMEPFMKQMKLAAPMDMKIGPDGALYIIEYGTNWFAKNGDAKLARIEYTEGNRNPVARIDADRVYGTAPMPVKFSAAGSTDYDGDSTLTYHWQIGKEEFTGSNIDYTFRHAGTHNVLLNVHDERGGKGSTTLQVKVGNTPPEVSIMTNANKTFYWDHSSFDYRVIVKDPEDGAIHPTGVKISLRYFEYGKDLASGFMDDPSAEPVLPGGKLIAGSDCMTCHATDTVSIGPAYREVAKRYARQSDAVAVLTKKVINGGSGNWGTRIMPGHPELAIGHAEEIVKYILSLNDASASMPLHGAITLSQHAGKGTDGCYLLTASYQDRGANTIEPLTTRESIILRNPLLQIEDFDEGNLRIGTLTTAFISFARAGNNKYVKFSQLDLKHVHHIKYRLQSHGAGGTISLHLDSLDGPVVSTVKVAGGNVKDLKTEWKEISGPVKRTSGLHDLYFVFSNHHEAPNKTLFHVDWIYFEGPGEEN